ncbi:hypothetical protein PoB_004089100 [Plakobranchus ocellatus]|uniref:Uncharacterized protein n=1 Tax=Plakobranchus ocellatus TaxID=259542 RepID=A0AAV4B6F7_9GAST|nr:hypothetical protein PoB_004089100 [Plakobranchus ocellatus]
MSYPQSISSYNRQTYTAEAVKNSPHPCHILKVSQTTIDRHIQQRQNKSSPQQCQILELCQGTGDNQTKQRQRTAEGSTVKPAGAAANTGTGDANR